MANSVAIRFENVSKQFRFSRERPRSLQELFLSWRLRPRHRSEQLWVVRDMTFHVGTGETMAIIGPNGAGKSTILKLIARIVSPTSGRIEVAGRVSSLLELGAGFHPDLTGRENIFLYGSLLGLSPTTMRQCFDEIVAFSELEEFIDIPVRTFSSGMYLRLAFSVAIHVRPDVLLIDEILAVGDEAFQAKCLARINALKARGVTILLVSHDMRMVRQLCNRAIWMDEGLVRAEGSAELVVRRYLDAVAQQQSEQMAQQNLEATKRARVDSSQAAEQAHVTRWGSGKVEITHLRVLDQSARERYAFLTGETLTIQMRYQAKAAVENPVFGLALHRSDGLHITGPNTKFGNLPIPRTDGEGIVEYTIAQLPLLPGRYEISVAAHDAADTEMFDYHDRMYSFVVSPGGTEERYGLMRMGGQWRLIQSQ